MPENAFEIWKAITTGALLGTARQPFSMPTSAGPLTGIFNQLSSANEPEARLLGAAAVLAVYQQSGSMPYPSKSAELPPPCPPENQKLCKPSVSRMLDTMINGERRDVLPEALIALAAAGQRAPEIVLPDLLEIGKKQRDLREHILPVIGRRGQWLGEQNADWSYAAGRISEEESDTETARIWREGSRDARRLLLDQLRSKQPVQALALLETTWASDGADERAAFIQALRIGLSETDEPFLEAALERDRGKEVRRGAAKLLAALPESRLVARMIARAESILALKRNLIGGQSIQVTLPDECDAAMLADAIEPKSPNRTMGDKAWWMRQILGAIPLSHWTSTWKKQPADLIAMAAKTEWAEPILLGWIDSAKEYADPEWTVALARHLLKQSNLPITELFGAIGGLSSASFEALALEVLKADPHPLHDGHPALTVLKHYPGQWTDRLAREVVQSIRKGIAKDSGQEQLWHTQSAFKEFAHHISPALVQELSQDWPEDENPRWVRWRHHVDEFLAILQFRHDLLKDIFS